MTKLSERLRIPRGVTAVVGSGGKTTLMERLACELSENARVLRMTTTQMRVPNGTVIFAEKVDACLLLKVKQAFEQQLLVTVGREAENGKITKPLGSLDALFALADYVLIEADGSRGLPLKAPAEHEPVLCGKEKLVLAVMGATGIGRPICEAAHRSRLYAALLHKQENEVVTAEDAARVLMDANGQRKGVISRFAIVLNQCDTKQELQNAQSCAAQTGEECALVALKTNADFCEMWAKGQLLR
ncbi:MAG: selenium cofactor biosynthesis protein YqeC [Clostridia bacterium]